MQIFNLKRARLASGVFHLPEVLMTLVSEGMLLRRGGSFRNRRLMDLPTDKDVLWSSSSVLEPRPLKGISILIF